MFRAAHDQYSFCDYVLLRINRAINLGVIDIYFTAKTALILEAAEWR
jgi:hypothetical protein